MSQAVKQDIIRERDDVARDRQLHSLQTLTSGKPVRQYDHDVQVMMDEYELTDLERIASGGFAIVYRGKLDGAVVAVKVMPCNGVDAGAMDRFLREARIHSRLRDSHIVQVLGVICEPDSQFGIVMELMSGTLSTIIHSDGGMWKELPILTRVQQYVIPILEGIIVIHSKSAAHRDLKSENIMIGFNGEVKIGDFGISSSNIVPTMTKFAALTLFNSPPEAFGEKKDLEHSKTKYDIYSFGVLLYEILTGDVPYDGLDVAGMIGVKLSSPGFLVNKLPVDVDPDLSGIVRDCMVSDGSQRPTAMQLLERVQSWIMTQSDTFSSLPSPTTFTPRTPSRRNSVIPKRLSVDINDKMPVSDVCKMMDNKPDDVSVIQNSCMILLNQSSNSANITRLIDADVIKRAASAMINFPHDVSIQQRCCTLLYNVSVKTESHDKIMEYHVIEHVLKSMVTFIDDVVIQQYSIGLFMNLARNHAINSVVVADDVLNTVMDVMDRYTMVLAVQQYACRMIASLSEDAGHNMQLMKCETLERALVAIESHSHDLLLSRGVCSFIASLSRESLYHEYVCNDGVLAILTNAMDVHTNDAAIVRQCCSVLQLYIAPQNDVTMTSQRVVPVIITVMYNHAVDAGIMKMACLILQYLLHDDQSVLLVVTNGVIACFTAALHNHSLDIDIVRCTLYCLNRISSVSQHAIRMVDEGCLKRVSICMEKFVDVDILRSCCHIMNNLSNSQELCSRLVYDSSCNFVIKTLDNHIDDVDMVNAITKTLLNISTVNDLQSELIKLGTLSSLSRVMQHSVLSDDGDVMANCCVLLSNFSNDSTICMDMIGLGILNVVLDIMSKHQTNVIIQCSCCDVLSHCSMMPSFISSICDVDVVDAVFHAIDVHVSHVGTVRSCCSVLHNVTITDVDLVHQSISHVFKCMTAHGDDVNIQLNGCALLYRLADGDDMCDYLVTSGCIHRIIEALTYHVEHKTINMSCVMILERLSMQPQHAIRMVDEGCLNRVSICMEKFIDVDILRSCCHIMNNLSNSQELCSRLVYDSSCNFVIKTLDNHIDDVDMVNAITKTLLNISTVDDLCVALCDHDVVARLAVVMTKHAVNVQKRAIETIRNLSLISSNYKKIMDNDAVVVKQMLVVMTSYANDLSISQFSCQILCNLSNEFAIKLVELGVLPILLQVITCHLDDLTMQTHAWCLELAISRHSQYVDQLHIQALLTSMKTFINESTYQRVAASLLNNIGYNADYCIKLTSEGAIRQMNVTLECMISDEQVVLEICTLFNKMSAVPANHSKLISENSPKRLLMVMDTHSKNTACLYECCCCLRNISVDTELHEYDASVIKALNVVVDGHSDVLVLTRACVLCMHHISERDNVNMFMTEHSSSRITVLMDTLIDDNDMQMYCIKTLQNIKSDQGYIDEMMSAGIVQRLVNAMAKYSDDSELHLRACQVLRDLTTESNKCHDVVQLGALTGLSVSLPTFLLNIEVTREACAVISNISTNVECHDALVTVVPSVLVVMDTHPIDAELQLICLKILRNVIQNSKILTLLLNNRVENVLSTAMYACINDASIQCIVMDVLNNMCDSGVPPQISEAVIIPHMLNVMDAHASDINVVKRCCLWLNKMTTVHACVSVMMSDGVTKRLLTSMKTFINESTYQRVAASLLNNIGYNADYCIKLTSEGAIRQMNVTLECMISDEQVVLEICTLFNKMSAVPANHSKLISENSPKRLLMVMDTHSKNTAIIHECLVTFQNILFDSSFSVKNVEDVLHRVSSLMAQSPDDDVVVYDCLTCLFRVTRRHDWVKKLSPSVNDSILALVISAMDNHGKHSSIQQTACALLGVYLTSEALLSVFIERSGIVRVLVAMDSLSDVCVIQRSGCVLLSFMTSNSDACKHMIDSNALKRVNKAMDSFPSDVTIIKHGWMMMTTLSRDIADEDETCEIQMKRALMSMELHYNAVDVQRSCVRYLTRSINKIDLDVDTGVRVITVVIRALNLYRNDVDVVRYSIKMLNNMVLNDVMYNDLLGMGTVRHVVCAMEACVDVIDIQVLAFKYMSLVTEQTNNLSSVFSDLTSGLDVCTKIMTKNIKNLDIQLSGMQFICHIMSINDMSTKIFDNGGMQCVLDAVVVHCDSIDLISHAVQIFVKMTQNNEISSKFDTNFILCLASVIEKHANSQTVVLHCIETIRNLSLISSNYKKIMDNDAVVVKQMLVVMTTYSNDLSISQFSCQILCNLSNEFAIKLIELGVLPILLQVITCHLDDLTIIALVCATLCALGSRPEGATAFSSQNVLEALMMIMEHYETNSNVIEYVSAVLMSISVHTCLHSDLTYSKCLTVITKSMAVHAYIVGIHRKCNVMLSNLSKSTDNHLHLISGGVIRSVMSSMRCHATDPFIQCSAFATLAMLSLDQSTNVHNEMITLGVERMIVTSYTHMPNDASLARVINSLVLNLSSNSSNIKVLTQSGLSSILMGIMTGHAGEAAIQQISCCIIYNLSGSVDIQAQLVSDGAASNIMIAMKNFINDAAVQYRGCAALWRLSNSFDNQMKSSVITSIVNAMEAHPNDVMVSQNACGFILNTCNNPKIGRDSQVIKVLFNAMDNHAGDVMITQRACSAIANISTTSETQAKLANDGAIKRLLTAIDNHPAHSIILQRACCALYNLGCTADNQLRMLVDGTIRRILTVIDNSIADAAVVQCACSVITVLGTMSANQIKLMAEGAYTRIVQVFEQHIKSRSTMYEAIGAMTNLTVNSNNQTKMVNGNAGQMIVRLMNEYPSDPCMIQRACSSIFNLGASYDNIGSLVDAGVVSSVLNAMDSHPGHSGVQHSACSCMLVLSRDIEVMKKMLNSGALRLLTRTLADHVTDAGVIQNATACVREISHYEQHHDAMVRLGLVQRLNATMKSHPSDRLIQHNSSRTLKNLSKVENVLDLIHKISGTGTLLDAMYNHPTDVDISVDVCTILSRLSYSAGNHTDMMRCDTTVRMLSVVIHHGGQSNVLEQLCAMYRNFGKNPNNIPRLVTENVIPKMLVIMEKHANNLVITQNVLDLLADLSSDQNAQRQCIESGVCGIIVTAMDMYVNNVTVQLYASRLLISLTLAPDYHAVILNDGIGKRLLTIMDVHNSDVYVTRNCNEVLQNLCSGICQSRVVADGCIKRLLTSMNSFPSDLLVQQIACTALHSLSSNVDNQSRLISEGVLPRISTAMYNFQSDVEIQRDACAMILKLSNSADNQARLLNEGLLKRLLIAMEVHRNDEIVQQRGCASLVNLSSNSVLVSKVIADGAMRAVLMSMDAFPDDVGVSPNACAAISNMTTVSQYHTSYYSDGVMARLTRAMDLRPHDSMCIQNACTALYNLSVQPSCHASWLQAGALSRLYRAMDMFSVPVYLSCLSAMSGMSNYRDNLKPLAASGAIKRVLNVMAANPAITHIQQNGCYIIANFANEIEYHAELLDNGGLRCIITAADIKDATTSRSVCRALAAVFSNKSFDTKYVTDAAIKTVIVCVDSFGSDIIVMRNAMNAFSEMYGFPMMNIAMKASFDAVFKRVITVIDANAVDLIVQEYGCASLYALSKFSTLYESSSKSNVETAIKRVITSMDNNSVSANIHRFGCGVMENAAYNADSSLKGIKKAMIKRIISTMDSLPYYAIVQKRCCWALCHCAANADVQIKLVNDGVVKRVVTTMSAHLSDVEVQTAAIAVMAKLSIVPDNVPKIACDDMFKYLVLAMDSHNKDPALLQNACVLLCNFSAINNEFRQRVVADGYVVRVLAAMDVNDSVRRDACSVLNYLCENDDVAVTYYVDVIRAMTKTMEIVSFKSDVTTMRYVCSTLCNLSNNDDACMYMSTVDMIKRLNSVMSSFESDPSIKQYVQTCISGINRRNRTFSTIRV